MDELGQPRKRIKIDSEKIAKLGNGTVTQSSTQPGSVTAPTRGNTSVKCDGNSPSTHLQFNPSVIERLRKITKEAQKNFPTSKSENSREKTQNGDRLPVNGEATKAQQDSGNDNEFIVSSTGSSPAHSPKLSDLMTLSTPPRPRRTAESCPEKFCEKLLDKFEEVFPANAKSSGSTVSCSGHSASKKGGRKRGQVSSDSVADTGKNGEIGKGWAKDEPVITVVEEKPTGGLTKAIQTDGNPRNPVDFSSAEFREVVRKLLQEKMTQMMSAITKQNEKYELKERMTTLEAENRALHSYASKLEGTVKQLLAEQRRRKDKVSSTAQTDPVAFNTGPPTPNTVPSAVKSSPGPTSSAGRSNNVNASTGTTTRITSTVAPLPGHTVPTSQPAVTHTSPFNPRSISTAQPQVTRTQAPHQPGPPPPKSMAMVHRPQAVPNQRYPSPYQPPSQVQSPHPMPPRSHPPTVTVRPQTQPPPSSPGAQGPFHRAPPPYGYAQSTGQTVYSNSQPTPTPQMQSRPNMVTTATRPQAPRLQALPAQGAPRLQALPAQGAPRLQALPAQGAPRLQALSAQGPPRFQGPRVQGPRVQNHASYMVREPLQSPQHQPPAYPHQEPDRLHPASERQPPMVVASIPQPARPVMQPPRPGLPPARPALPPARMQVPLTSGHASVAPVNPPPHQLRSSPAQQQMAVCAPPGASPAVSFIQAESRVQGPAVSVSSGVQQNGDGSGGGNESPPKPTVSIAVVMSGIVLSWNMSLGARHAKIVSYQLFALQDGSSAGAANQWKKIGVVKALPLPMACTLTQFLPGNKYHFAVRASDSLGRSGPFSEPCTITLK